MEGRRLNKDLFSLGLLAIVIILAISLVTYDPADPVAEITSWAGSWYQADQVVYPANEKIQNACGRLGAVVSDSMFSALGLVAYYVVGCMGLLCFWIMTGHYKDYLFGRGLGWVISVFGIATLLSLFLPHISPGPVIGGGGYLGYFGSSTLLSNFAFTGSLIVSFGATIIGVMMWTDYALLNFFQRVAGSAAGTWTVAKTAADKKIRQAVQKRYGSRANSGDLEIEDPDIAGSDAVGAHAMGSDDGYEPAVIIGGKRRDGGIEIEGAPEDEDWAEDGSDEESPSADQNWDEESEDDLYEDEQSLIVKMPSVEAISEQASEMEDELDDEMDEESEALVVKTAAKKMSSSVKTPSNKKLTKDQQREQEKDQISQAIQSDGYQGDEYELPAIELLEASGDVCYEQQEVEVRKKAKILEETFQEFGFNIKVVEIETGPVIAQYELALESGLRLSKIMGLADDLAISLRVPSVRIVAPIPGKNTVGVEVPNDTRQVVRLREVMEECSDKTKKMKIPVFLGKDVSGNPLVADLAALPHLLIAGRTGTGKSVCLNAIIASMLMTRRPDEVRMLMIDPKMVELSGYGRLPHLMHPVVTDMKKAEAILAWAVDKMEERYSLLAQVGVRHLTNFNQLGAEEIYRRVGATTPEEQENVPTNLPFIVIIADEMADLMMTAGKTVEQWIIRLAQKSRAVGIHLILATQKPTVDVITGLIKSNLPARIAFQVASKTDSRVVLDENGADRLLGNGDMLFLGPSTSILARGQGTYLSDDELDAVVESASASGKQDFITELVNLKVESEEEKSADSGKKRDDDLYESAVDAVIREQRGSVSMLQRILGIGYGRAARMIDYMAEDGIVGPYNGKVREVIMTPEAWAAKQAGGDEADLIAELGGGDSTAPAPPSPPKPTNQKPPKPKLKLETPSETEEPSDTPQPRRKSGPIRLVDPSELNDKGKTITVSNDNKVAPVIPAEPEDKLAETLPEEDEVEEQFDDDEEYYEEEVEGSAEESEVDEDVEYEEYEDEDVEWEDAE